jgi:acetyltransferase-like isoleucine patch superfamily enzyme
MDQPFEIKIARESANDDTVTVQEWHFPNGAKVKAGDIVVSLETSKAVLEVEAEVEGYLEILVPAGTVAEVGTVIGVLNILSSSSRKEFEAEKGQGFGQGQARELPLAIGKARYSKLALAMMAHHGIAAEALPQHGLVRKQDVEAYLRQQDPENGGGEELVKNAADHTLAHTQTVLALPTLTPHADRVGNAVSPPSTITVDDNVVPLALPTLTPHADRVGNAVPPVGNTGNPDGNAAPAVGFFSDARKSAGERGKGIVWVGLNYIFRNYFLGHLARWAPLGINLLIHRLRGVKMGKGVYIDPSATIETAYPENITIGNDVRITANAIIMTHIKAPHALRNQGIIPLVKQPVVLEDHCFIGVNAVIMPGVTIGRGSVVTSGSVVLTNVPPAVMVTGNPAKIVKRLNPVL